ncbi:MAG: hypothetical protein H0X11_14830 [Betaproteobacteria bacterium]|nr:hypothetical protein [Betaproteobacteria bacterium]
MNNPLQHVPALLKRRAQWPVSNVVVNEDDKQTSLPVSEVTLQARPELTLQVRPEPHASSPGGYNPYWDLPPA